MSAVYRLRRCILAVGFLFCASLSADVLPASRPNILLIVIDTLRYDATTFGNQARNATPFLASLAPRAVVFTAAYSTHDFTPTSHFSMVTGLRDGLGTDEDRIENGLPYQLRRIGYFTFATIANGMISPTQMPTLRAFDNFTQPGDITDGTINEITSLTAIDARLAMFNCYPTPRARAMLYFSADRLLPIFLKQMRRAPRPFFGFINLVDPHEPYIPNPEIYPPEKTVPPGFNGDVIQRRLSPELTNPDAIADPQRRAYVKGKIAEVGAASLVAIDLSPEARALYRKRYQAKVRGVEATLRQFFAVAEREHLLDNTFVIITSDHGESFGEADLITHMFHDRGDYESTHHVPLVIIVPPKTGKFAKTIDRRVSIASIAPTVYDIAGLNWSELQKRYGQYPPSLFLMLSASPARYLASVVVPKPAGQDQSDAERERAKAIRALGYVQP